MAVLALYGTPAQYQVITCPARYIGFFAGRRYGKTYTIRNRILKRCAIPNLKYWYLAPSYSQVKESFESIADARDMNMIITRSPSQPYPEIIFRNGARVGFRSFDRPKNLRSAGLDEVAVDEIQDIDEKEFWAVVRPLISDRRGSLIVSGQFRGENWYYDFFVKGAKSHPSRQCFIFPSSSGLMFQNESGKAELRDAKEALPKAVYDQEYECLPVANQAAVFRPEDLKAIQKGSNPAKPIDGRTYIDGLDLGMIADPSGHVVIDTQARQVVFSQLRPLGERHEIGAQQAARLSRTWNNCLIVIDFTGGATGGKTAESDEYVKMYREAVPNIREFYINLDSKDRLIKALALAIEKHELSIPPENKELLKQLSLYEFSYKDGRYKFHGPKGHTDDLVMALALAWYGVMKRWSAPTGGAPLSAAF